MLRRMGAGLLCCLALGACEIDSRDVVASSSLLPGASGAGAAGGLVVQPASVAYGPITMGFAASAHFFVENAGASQLPAPVFWIDGEGASAFTITQNDCTAPL